MALGLRWHAYYAGVKPWGSDEGSLQRVFIAAKHAAAINATAIHPTPCIRNALGGNASGVFISQLPLVGNLDIHFCDYSRSASAVAPSIHF
jgi:hypothetical protein